MKTGSTRIAVLRLVIFIFLLLYSLLVFSQTHIVLPARSLVQFSVSDKKDGVELKGTLMSSHTFENIVIERTTDGINFQAISQLKVTDNTSLYPFTFVDKNASKGTNYYRVQLISSQHNLWEVSNILVIKRDKEDVKALKVVNTMVQSNYPQITLNVPGNEAVTYEITNMSGMRISTGTMQLNHGSTQVYMPSLAGKTGYFVIVAKTKRDTIQQKFIVQ